MLEQRVTELIPLFAHVFGMDEDAVGRLELASLDRHERYARAWLRALQGGDGGG